MDIGGLIVLLFAVTAIFLFLLLVTRLERILDRYRLKYGFDREIEKKEVSGKEEWQKDDHVDRRERMFKRRVFKD